MHLNVRVKKSASKVFIELNGVIYTPLINTVLGQHDVVSVDARPDQLAKVFIKHYPPEEWVPLKE